MCLSECPCPSLCLKNLPRRHRGSWPVAGARFLGAQTCPWTQGLHTSRLSSTPGTRGFRIGVVLLLDWLPSLTKDVWSGVVVFQGSPKFWGQCTSPEPLGHRATRHFIGKLTYMHFCRRVACKYFGAYGTRTRVVHVVGFWAGPKFWGQCASPKPLSHRADIISF